MNEGRLYNIVLKWNFVYSVDHEKLCCRNDYGVESGRNNVCL